MTPPRRSEVAGHSPTTGRRPVGAAGRTSPCRGARGARRQRSRCYQTKAGSRRCAAAAGSPMTTRAAPPGRSRTGGTGGMPASAISSSRTVSKRRRRSAGGALNRSVAGAWSPRRRTRPVARGRAGCSGSSSSWVRAAGAAPPRRRRAPPLPVGSRRSVEVLSDPLLVIWQPLLPSLATAHPTPKAVGLSY